MKRKSLVIGGVVIAAVLAGGWAWAQTQPGGFGPPFMRGMGPGGMGPGGMGSGMMHMRDRMGPGMRGMGSGMMGGARDSATMAQIDDIHGLLVNHDRIRRTVTNLPDGIRTVTESDDPEIAALIKTHVAQMGERVRTGDDPGLPIESAALRAIFRYKDKINTSYETSDKSVVVVQTSTDPQAVAVLQQHAGEVTDLVKGGMMALHTAMIRNNGGMMRGPMMHGRPGANAQPNAR